MTIHKKNGVSYITFNLFDQYELKHGIFMRHGGVSPAPWRSLNLATSVGDSRENVIENRNRIVSSLGLNAESIFDVWQVHSNKVIRTNNPRALDQTHQRGDAIVTNCQNVSLLMLFADCVPVLLMDIEKRVIAIAHAGWQGTLNEVVLKTIQEMINTYQCEPKDLIAGIGPAICQDHYEVGSDVIKRFKKTFKYFDQVLKNKGSRTYLDLRKANLLMLKNANIKDIEMMNICTACHTQDWFSHRAENQLTGRFGAIISLD